MLTVEQYLKSQGRSYPTPDKDGNIPFAEFATRHLPPIIACASCAMTMALTADLPCDDHGAVYCADCAND